LIAPHKPGLPACLPACLPSFLSAFRVPCCLPVFPHVRLCGCPLSVCRSRFDAATVLPERVFVFDCPLSVSPATAAAVAAVSAALWYVWSFAEGGVRMCVRARVRVLCERTILLASCLPICLFVPLCLVEFSICLLACLPACLRACLPACLVCLPACLAACLSACLSVRLSVCVVFRVDCVLICRCSS